MTGTTPNPANLLGALPEALATALFARARPVRLKADQVLFRAGDRGDGCYRVDEGILKVSIDRPFAGERILAILGPGSLVGELSMIDASPRSATVVALKDAQLTFISRLIFEAFAEDHPEMSRYLVRLLARRLRDANAAIAAASFDSLKGRVARAMLSLAEAFGDDVGGGRVMIRQKISQADLAAMAGIARENVSRILSEWNRDGLITRVSGCYCLERAVELAREAAS